MELHHHGATGVGAAAAVPPAFCRESAEHAMAAVARESSVLKVRLGNADDLQTTKAARGEETEAHSAKGIGHAQPA